MNYATPELETVSQQLHSLERLQKPKMLVVDDEPDNLDLLYRTFRREFNVLRAESGVVALDILSAEGEVAVIISDQRMPEMKGTEFLSKTVPQFPNTMRIILTGFTDVEDLVDAINSGQVYKYITKPWDPNELKTVVQRAAETYELFQLRVEELQRAQAQTILLSKITQTTQHCDSLETCLAPIAQAFGEAFQPDVCIVQMVESGQLAANQGIYSTFDVSADWLQDNPSLQEAIASQQVKVAFSNGNGSDSLLPCHVEAGIKLQLGVPIVFQSRVLAVLCLQWRQPRAIKDDELNTLYLSAQQTGLALMCTRLCQVKV